MSDPNQIPTGQPLIQNPGSNQASQEFNTGYTYPEGYNPPQDIPQPTSAEPTTDHYAPGQVPIPSPAQVHVQQDQFAGALPQPTGPGQNPPGQVRQQQPQNFGPNTDQYAQQQVKLQNVTPIIICPFKLISSVIFLLSIHLTSVYIVQRRPDETTAATATAYTCCIPHPTSR